jgi:uncharacterized membrane protein YccF (DUF307 family)
MTLILNILWFIFGGWISGLAWLLATLILAVTIVGLPWAAASFRIAIFSFAPFGKMVSRRAGGELGLGCMDLFLNILWFLVAGWWLALHHVILGIALMISIIGIPFGFQHFKLAAVSLAPVGRTIIDI